MSDIYRVIWVGADCRPFAGSPMQEDEAIGHFLAGQGGAAAIVRDGWPFGLTIDREGQKVTIDLTNYGEPNPERKT